MKSIYAVNLVCPAKFAEINSIGSDIEDFKKHLSDALVELEQYYEALVDTVAANFPSDASTELRKTIKANEESAMEAVGKKIQQGHSSLADFFKDNQAKQLKFVQDNVGPVCDKVEIALRETVALFDYQNLKAANRRNENNAIPFDEITKPNDVDATILQAVVTANEEGNNASGIFAIGIASIYDQLHMQIKECKVQVATSSFAFDQTFGSQASDDSANLAIKKDWDVVQNDKKRVFEYELSDLSTSPLDIPADLTGDKLVNHVVQNIGGIYEAVLADINQKTKQLFVDMTILEFDMTY